LSCCTHHYNSSVECCRVTIKAQKLKPDDQTDNQKTDYQECQWNYHGKELTNRELNKGVYLLRGTHEEVAAAVVD